MVKIMYLGNDQSEALACKHEWEIYGDFELGGGREEVRCNKCGTFGERNENGEVDWPVT